LTSNYNAGIVPKFNKTLEVIIHKGRKKEIGVSGRKKGRGGGGE
jgi:hypothetical protein